MRHDLYRLIGVILATIVGLLGVAAFLHVLVTLPLKGKEAEWVGSIGTVGTLIGTIWLATAERRDEHKRAKDRAYVAAIGLQMKVADVKNALQAAVEHFLDDFQSGFGLEYGKQAAILQSAGTWTDEEIVPLIVMPNRVCARLAHARSVIAKCVNDLGKAEETKTYSWARDQKAKTDAKILAALIQGRDTVAFCKDEFENFRKKMEAD